MKRILVALLLLTGACGAAAEIVDEPSPGTSAGSATVAPAAAVTTTTLVPDATRVAPWNGTTLAGDQVPAVVGEQWAVAGNRDWCSALYPADTAVIGPAATIRSANFGSGWGVAWDLPNGPGRLASGEYCADCGRGAFGIAGTEVLAVGDETDRWPTTVDYDDGSRFGYGYEGDAAADSGALLLAQLLVRDEGCLFNVWSFLGEEHLLELIGQLNRVDGLQGVPTKWLSELPPPEVGALGDPPWDEAPLPADQR